MRFKKIILFVIASFVFAFSVYQIPAVKSRLDWRIDIANVFIRGIVKPVGDLPTPIARTTRPVIPTLTLVPTYTPGPTQTPFPSPTPIPSAYMLPPPKWEFQDWNNCGPASLSLYLKFYGWVGDQYTISSQIKPERGDRNVNIEEMLSYARNQVGWLQSRFRVGGNINLLKQFIAVGIPVMVEEGFLLEESYWLNDDNWAGHYLLLTAYDDAAETFTGQDTFVGADRLVTYQELDENWRAFNRVFMLIYPASHEETVKAILGEHWDPDSNRQAALETAQAEIEADPEDVFAWFNLGSNLMYFERYQEAAIAYDEARRIGWPQRMLRYQFGPYISYFHSGRMEDLLAIAEYNLERITPNSEEAFIWKGWALYRLGDSAGAVESFRSAYESNPTSIDAKYALDFMGAAP